MLTDLVIGKTVDEAMAIHEEFLALMQGKGTVEPDEDVLEDGDRLRRRREVPGARQVRTTVVDGLEGRHRPDPWRRSMTTMTDHSDLPEVPEAAAAAAPRPSPSTTSPRR